MTNRAAVIVFAEDIFPAVKSCATGVTIILMTGIAIGAGTLVRALGNIMGPSRLPLDMTVEVGRRMTFNTSTAVSRHRCYPFRGIMLIGRAKI
jgi:hypothetical protein